MADFPISGKPIPEINLREITVSEWRALFSLVQSETSGDVITAKISGIKPHEIRDLKYYDNRALFNRIFDEARKTQTIADRKFPVSGEPLPNINLREMTVMEWRSFYNDNFYIYGIGDETVSHVSGMSLDALLNLKYPDYCALCQLIKEQAAKPLENDPKE